MSGRIRDTDVSYVRDHSPIDEVVSDYVQLKSAGGGQKKGLCPFHDEKSPSFHVTPARGYFHCFGCQEGGDVIAFIMKIDHLSFTETIERLASRIGYQLTYEQSSGGPKAPTVQRSRLLEANSQASLFYQEQLQLPTASHARELLIKRGFDKTASQSFEIGYAPDQWDALSKFLLGKGFSAEELLLAGLTKEGTKGAIDRFRNRLIWPIRDISGDLVGFGARKLASDEEDTGPKYLNTPETSIYKKSQVLYGLDKAKKEIAKKRQVVIVEGYTDVMAAHLAGIPTAVATCGTAFGDEHIRILRRLLMDDDAFRGEVIFTFDGDAAGQKAALRAFGDDQKFVTQTFVAVEPSGLDPSDLRQEMGDAALRDLIARRVPLFEFAIKSSIKQFDLGNADGRVQALNAAAPLIGRIRDTSLRPEYARSLAGWLGMEVEVVMAAVKKNTSTRSTSVDAALAGEQWRPDPSEPRLILEREVLKVRLQMPALFRNWPELEKNAFSHPAYIKLREFIDTQEDLMAVNLEATDSDELKSFITELMVEPIRTDGEISDRYVSSITARLNEVALARSIAEVKSSLQRLNPLESESEYNQMFSRLVEMEAKRRALRELALGESLT
ncbi:MAG: DNA primase [Candidatus Nanopelagicales bacterium]|jgi:DNA primase|uniref:DNA primase n=5 Tax=ac1 cluster TaxID=1655545 RepID=A0A0R2P6B4_9ACTN|nr:MAG: DNA primase [Actinobacteria bacterium BACL2 MAG-120802-bin41]KRO44814.1 MAG: DNA primase [Actinobacteria bacterium BACL2 MAG-120813-bin23]MDP4751557.1 DNA primase [Candidatus Nanopelagicales bacterium]MDP4864966.1 DNA primase [Candidatus Nanopelagicaceae bacterium]MDP5046508.1 DNA primase [Candidatus Nanopelagicaceae bacterium]